MPCARISSVFFLFVYGKVARGDVFASVFSRQHPELNSHTYSQIEGDEVRKGRIDADFKQLEEYSLGESVVFAHPISDFYLLVTYHEQHDGEEAINLDAQQPRYAAHTLWSIVSLNSSTPIVLYSGTLSECNHVDPSFKRPIIIFYNAAEFRSITSMYAHINQTSVHAQHAQQVDAEDAGQRRASVSTPDPPGMPLRGFCFNM